MEWIWQGSLLPQWAWTISSLQKWIFSLHFHAGPEGPGATAATGKPKTELTGVRCEASALFWSALKTLVGAHRSALGQRKREAFWHFLLRRHAILPRWSAPAALSVVSWGFFFVSQCPRAAQFAVPGLSLRCAWLEEERSLRELAQRPSLDTKSLTLRLRHLTFTDSRRQWQHFRKEAEEKEMDCHECY